MRKNVALLGMLCASAPLWVAGCDGDSHRRAAPPTATREVGATETAPPHTHTATPRADSPTAAPSLTSTPTPDGAATSTACPFTPTPGASATASGSPTVTFTALICPAQTETPTPVVDCTDTPVPTTTGTPPPRTVTPTPGLAVLRWFDANPRSTSGVFLPLAEYSAESVRVFTTDAWLQEKHEPFGAAADGATLILISLRLVDPGDDAPVRLRVDAGFDPDVGPTGGLFAVDDQRLVDRSADGGAIDSLPDGPAELLVETVVIDGERWAFALYRAPRDYDGANPLNTRSRPTVLAAHQDSQLLNETRFVDIVRPLVIFVHGTAGDTSNWNNFPLWRDSANEINGFTGGVLPFYADRISFQWIALSAGPLTDNAATILPQIGRALEGWQSALNVAATQADVVTHSYGGAVARQVAQTQPDPGPLTTADQANFRAATNWGHGVIRKLVTLAATHRGSALANSTAYLNQLQNGVLRAALCLDGLDIGAGALADQMVISPALGALRETRLPGHAMIGSGSVQYGDPPFIAGCFEQGVCEVCYPASGYHGEFDLYRNQDAQNGPYRAAGDLGGSFCGTSAFCEDFNYVSYDRLTNYSFNLAYAEPFPYPDCDLPTDFPNYDLTVSACSSRGQQPVGAYTTVDDIDPALRGRLSHLQMVSSPVISDRVRFLLEQPTTSEHFAHFQATGGPTCLEEQLMQIGTAADLSAGQACASGPDNSLINSCYNSCDSCAATADTPPCFVEYRVVSDPLVLRQIGQAAPLLVYGRVTRGPLDGQWTNLQSLANQIWCSVTMTSQTDSVVRITTWKDISGYPDQSGIDVVEAVGDGFGGVSLAVQNKMDGPIVINVTVDTTPPAEPES